MTQRRSAIVVEDDAAIRELLAEVLVAAGFAVHLAQTGDEGLRLAEQVQPDLVTLDVGLPGVGGMEVCRQIRQISDAYIVMITGRTDEADRLLGLSNGADDYVIKPFSPRELQARVAAMFRRPRYAPAATGVPAVAAPTAAVPNTALPQPVGGQQVVPVPGQMSPVPGQMSPMPGQMSPMPSQMSPMPSQMPEPIAGSAGAEPGTASPSLPAGAPAYPPGVGYLPVQGGYQPTWPERTVFDHAGVQLDLESRAVTRDGEPLALTRIEFELLARLISNPRRVWPRDELLREVWGQEFASDYHVVDVHIGNLRRKLGPGPNGQGLIRTVRGVGFGMVVP